MLQELASMPTWIQHFSSECSKNQKQSNHNSQLGERKIPVKPMRAQSKNNQTAKARENLRGRPSCNWFSFASDWLIKEQEFSGSIPERGEAKSLQFRLTFDTQLRIALTPNKNYIFRFKHCKCFEKGAFCRVYKTLLRRTQNRLTIFSSDKPLVFRWRLSRGTKWSL